MVLSTVNASVMLDFHDLIFLTTDGSHHDDALFMSASRCIIMTDLLTLAMQVIHIYQYNPW